MRRSLSHPQGRLYLAAAATLLVGLVGSAAIYLTAPDGGDETTISAFENSKAYRHDLELYGGKVNVLADEFMRWFGGLWHGRALAGTVAVIALLISTVLFLVAYYLLHDETPDGRADDRKE